MNASVITQSGEIITFGSMKLAAEYCRNTGKAELLPHSPAQAVKTTKATFRPASAEKVRKAHAAFMRGVSDVVLGEKPALIAYSETGDWS